MSKIWSSKLKEKKKAALKYMNVSKPELLPELRENNGFSQVGYTSWSLDLSVLSS